MTAIAIPAVQTRVGRPNDAPPRLGLELRLLLREPMVIIGLLGFPLVTMLVIAGVFGQVPDPEFGGVAPDDHYIAGYIGVVLGALGHRHPPGLRRHRTRARRDPTLPGRRA